MFDPMMGLRAMATWQKASLAYGQMLFTANQVIAARVMQMSLGTMKPEEATRMVLEKPAAFAKAMEMSGRTLARNQGYAAAALAGIRPVGAKTAANAKRLRKRR